MSQSPSATIATVWVVRNSQGQPSHVAFRASDGSTGSQPAFGRKADLENAMEEVIRLLQDRGITDIRWSGRDPISVGSRVRFADHMIEADPDLASIGGVVACITGTGDGTKAHVETNRYNTMVIRIRNLTPLF